MDQNMIILICIIIGCVLRTLVPYFKKIYAGEIKEFDVKFMVTLILMVIVGVIAGFTVFPTFIPPIGNMYMIVVASLLGGWGSQSVINNIMGLFLP